MRSYEYCYNLAKKCEKRQDLRKKDEVAYRTALKNGWFKDYTWLIKTWGKYNYETCLEIAKQCKSRTEFKKLNSSAYTVARKNGWLDEYTWMPSKTDINSKINYVYAYEFNDTHSVYIGRTIDIIQRDKAHHFSGTVFNFSTEKNLPIPKPIIKYEKLDLKESCVKENEVLENYKVKGWSILNKAKTGEKSSSCGNLFHNDKYSYEEIENIAKQYQYFSDFRKNHLHYYNYAKHKNWISKFTWLKNKNNPQDFYTYEKCKEESLKYSSISDFQDNSQPYYTHAVENGWLDDFIWISRKIVQYNLDGTFVAIYNNVNDAISKGYTWHISNVINHKRKQSQGYIWRFAKEVFVNGEILKQI